MKSSGHNIFRFVGILLPNPPCNIFFPSSGSGTQSLTVFCICCHFQHWAADEMFDCDVNGRYEPFQALRGVSALPTLHSSFSSNKIKSWSKQPLKRTDASLLPPQTWRMASLSLSLIGLSVNRLILSWRMASPPWEPLLFLVLVCWRHSLSSSTKTFFQFKRRTLVQGGLASEWPSFSEVRRVEMRTCAGPGGLEPLLWPRANVDD